MKELEYGQKYRKVSKHEKKSKTKEKIHKN